MSPGARESVKGGAGKPSRKRRGAAVAAAGGLAPVPEFVPDGTAVVYAEGAFGTPSGKTAHGLVRQTRRYAVVAVLDSRHAGKDAGEVLDGKPSGIPIVGNLDQAFAAAKARGESLTHLVIGLAPDGGRLPAAAPHRCAGGTRARAERGLGSPRLRERGSRLRCRRRRARRDHSGRAPPAPHLGAPLLHRQDRRGRLGDRGGARHRLGGREADDGAGSSSAG